MEENPIFEFLPIEAAWLLLLFSRQLNLGVTIYCSDGKATDL
jgi:hypothetical protein